MHCLSHATLAAAGRGGGNTSSNNNGSTNITITIPKAASSSTDINLLGDFTPTYATANFHYGIYFKNNSVTSETQYATAGQSVTFNDVKYDTYDFCLDIYVDSYKKTKLNTITVNKTVSASDNTVQFPDMSVSTYSKWYFVKDSADLTTAISKIEAGGYTEASPAKLCLTASIEDERATEIKNNNKIEIVYNDFELEPHLYNITISPVTGGTVTADCEKASAGKTVTLTVTPATGMKLYSISVGGNDATAGINTTTVTEGTKYEFTMPAYNVNVNAVFKRYYTVTFQDYEGNDVGDTLEFYEDDTLSFGDAKDAIPSSSIPTGSVIVAFKRTSPEPVTSYRETNFPIIFSSTNFSVQNITLQTILALDIGDLGAYLDSLTPNEPATKYMLPEITVTASNWGTLNTILNNHPTIYVDLSATTLPSSLDSMYNGFNNCKTLVIPPAIPNNVQSLENCFQRCINLAVAPEIPPSVTGMYGCFFGCTSLTTAPEIPINCDYLKNCFRDCTSLSGTVTINASVSIDNASNFEYMFRDVDESKITKIKVPDSDTQTALRSQISDAALKAKVLCPDDAGYND